LILLKDCLMDPNPKSNLELLNLESNQITHITESNIELFKLLRSRNSMFKVKLISNPFICDCNLLSFYKWIQTIESNEIILNKNSLACIHPNSLQLQFKLPIYHSELDKYCENVSNNSNGDNFLNIDIESTTQR